MTQFLLKRNDGTITEYESRELALNDLFAEYPSGGAKNPQGISITPQTKDWPVRDGLLFTFWTDASAVDDPSSWYAQLVVP